MNFTVTDPELLRALANDDAVVSLENRIGESNGHAFRPGDKALLVGLESFPEYNGSEVTITNIRENGDHGRAYYVKGQINQHLNWVYEYRLSGVSQ